MGSSNPGCDVIWTLDGDDVTDQATVTRTGGEHRGEKVESQLDISGRENNGKVLKCEIFYDGGGVDQKEDTLDITCEFLYQNIMP